jgi:pyruvate dehydrogenase E2 component (dihydrolipoamide acetyltransferase)
MGEIIEVRVPDIGGATDVEVIEVLRAVGDTIEIDDELISVETDKATMGIPMSSAGILREIKVAVGGKISEGDVIATLEIVADAGSGEKAVSLAESRHQTAERSFPTHDSAAAEVAEPFDVRAPGGPDEEPASHASLSDPAVASTPATSLPYATPSIRKLARELLVPLASVPGSGPKGRLTQEDIFSYVRSVMKNGGGATGSGSASTPFADLLPWPKIDFEKFGPVQRRAMPRIRKISGANLHRNWVTIPHVTNHEDADITELEALRQQLNEENSKKGIKLTLLAFLVKASVAALKEFPEFNASLDGEEIVLKSYYHIGFAADTPSGLVVPVIRDADKKGVIEIAEEMSALAAKAREGKLSAADMSGGCFSISSLGGIGGTYFTPIINAPEVAILGVSKSRIQLVWNGKKAKPRLILPLSLSWDHRVVDGAMAGRFNAYLAAMLNDFRRTVL